MWKTTALILTGTCLFLAVAVVSLSAVHADETNKIGKDGIAREIDLKGYRAERQKGDVSKPTRITSAEELAKVIPDREWRERITKQVDFKKRVVLRLGGLGTGQALVQVKRTKEGAGRGFQLLEGETATCVSLPSVRCREEYELAS
jgi:hypothetical protein